MWKLVDWISNALFGAESKTPESKAAAQHQKETTHDEEKRERLGEGTISEMTFTTGRREVLNEKASEPRNNNVKKEETRSAESEVKQQPRPVREEDEVSFVEVYDGMRLGWYNFLLPIPYMYGPTFRSVDWILFP